MNPVSTNASVVPSLDELERMTSVPDERVVIRGVDWAFYEQLVDSISAGANIHADFDGKDVEIMSVSLLHNDAKGLAGQLVALVAEVWEIPFKSAGQTTWKCSEVARGLEADKSYYFRPEKLAAAAEAKARRSMNLADYPNPDLAIEVELSPSQIDRPGIYAALGVAEVWRFDGDRLVIERLSADRTFVAVDASGFLPIRAEEIVRWVIEEDTTDESAWARRLRAWARTELVTRVARCSGDLDVWSLLPP
jgi:Uma2 family endonuclease